MVLASGDVERDVEANTLADILASSSKTDLKSEDAGNYLSHLTTLSLPELLAEPTNLQTQSHHLTSSLTALTHTSYPAFLDIHRNTVSLSDSLSSMTNSLESLLSESLPKLSESSSKGKARTEGVLTERRQVRIVLDQYEKIRDLLDIPLLIDTCVRNGYYSEALALAAHAKAVTASLSKSSPPPAILISVNAEVAQSMRSMLLTLLSTIHEPNRKLPALWKAITFLRKMEVFDSEEELALAFLAGREGCLKVALDGCGRDVQVLVKGLGEKGELGEREREDAARYLKRFIDSWREGVYDIVTQFTTIFLERSPSTGGSHSTTPKASNVQPDPSFRALLATYTTHSLTTHLLPTLKQFLPHVPSSLPSLLTQLTYCATAFARVGLDFRGVLGGLFEDAVGGSVGKEIRGAGEKWTSKVRDAIAGGASQGTAKSKAPLVPSKWLISSNLISSPPVPSSDKTSNTPIQIPPAILAIYPPLAELTNILLGSFNHLRLLAPMGVLGELLVVLETVLAECGTILLQYGSKFSSSSHNGDFDAVRETEKAIIHATGQVYVRVFVPFIRRALVEGVYASEKPDGMSSLGEGSELAQVLGEWEAWLEGSDS